jgi:hypothetical protein
MDGFVHSHYLPLIPDLCGLSLLPGAGRMSARKSAADAPASGIGVFSGALAFC